MSAEPWAASLRASLWTGTVWLVGLLLVGASLLQPRPHSPERLSSTPLAEARSLEAKGDFTVPANGFRMPASVGPFSRVELHQYDAEGRNVSAGYNALVGDAPALPIAATLYVYPQREGDELDAAFERLLADIGRQHEGARPDFRERIRLTGSFAGRYAGFGYAEPWGGLDRDVPLRSYAVLYAWRGWWVKWRVTTPAPISEERMRAIVDLTETLLPPD